MKRFDIGEGVFAIVLGGPLAAILFIIIAGFSWGWSQEKAINGWISLSWLWAPLFFWLGGRDWNTPAPPTR